MGFELNHWVFCFPIINHVKNVVFVLVLNKKQLEESVRCIYGSKIEADTYLQKFINVECELPVDVDFSTNHPNGYKKFCEYLHEAHGLKGNKFIIDTFITLAEHYGLSLRVLERCYTSLTLFTASIPKGDRVAWPIVVFLILMKYKSFDTFVKLKNENISFAELSKQNDLAKFKMPTTKKGSRTASLLYYELELIMTNDDTHYENLTTNNQEAKVAMTHLRPILDFSDSRNEIIPHYCSQIDFFNFSILNQ